MRTTSSLALASILTLGIAGASPAHAGGATATTTAPIRLFGTTMCLPAAPATARCDVRLTPPTPGVVRWFGKTWNIGAPSGTRGDPALPACAAASAAACRPRPGPPATSTPTRRSRSRSGSRRESAAPARPTAVTGRGTFAR